MAKEVLAIPEECLGEVIRVIRAGLKAVTVIKDQGTPSPTAVRKATVRQLQTWCNEEAAYARRSMGKEYQA